MHHYCYSYYISYSDVSCKPVSSPINSVLSFDHLFREAPPCKVILICIKRNISLRNYYWNVNFRIKQRLLIQRSEQSRIYPQFLQINLQCFPYIELLHTSHNSKSSFLEKSIFYFHFFGL